MGKTFLQILFLGFFIGSGIYSFNGEWDKATFGIACSILLQMLIYRQEDTKE